MTSPRRVARTEHWVQGRTLPQPGTFQEQLLVELSNREKNRDFARMYVIVEMIRGAFDLDPTRTAELLDLFESELHQETYVPTFIQEMRHKIQARKLAQAAEKLEREAVKAAVSARVASMTVSEEDLKPIGH